MTETPLELANWQSEWRVYHKRAVKSRVRGKKRLEFTISFLCTFRFFNPSRIPCALSASFLRAERCHTPNFCYFSMMRLIQSWEGSVDSSDRINPARQLKITLSLVCCSVRSFSSEVSKVQCCDFAKQSNATLL